jgi:hypothetical protein
MRPLIQKGAGLSTLALLGLLSCSAAAQAQPGEKEDQPAAKQGMGGMREQGGRMPGT